MLCKVRNPYEDRDEFVFMPRGYKGDEDYVESLLNSWGLELIEVLCDQRCKDGKDGCLTTQKIVDKFNQQVPVCFCKKMQQIKALESKQVVPYKITTPHGLSESSAS